MTMLDSKSNAGSSAGDPQPPAGGQNDMDYSPSDYDSGDSYYGD